MASDTPTSSLNWAIPIGGGIAVQSMIAGANDNLLLSGVFVDDPDFDPDSGTIQTAAPCFNSDCRLAFSLDH